MNLNLKIVGLGLTWWLSGKESTCQCRLHELDPWSGKIPHATEQPYTTKHAIYHNCWANYWALEPGNHNYRSRRTLEPMFHKRSHRILLWFSTLFSIYWVPYTVPLTSVFILPTIPHNFDYYGYKISLETGRMVPLTFLFLFYLRKNKVVLEKVKWNKTGDRVEVWMISKLSADLIKVNC